MSTGRTPGWAIAAVAAALMATAGPADAHNRSTSYSSWRINGRAASVTLRMTALDLSRFSWLAHAGANFDRAIGEHAAQRLRLVAGRTPCRPKRPPRRMAASPDSVVLEWEVACPAEGNLRIHNDLLYDVAPSHLHFARVRVDGRAAMERVLSDAERDWPLTTSGPAARTQPSGSPLVRYVRIGIDHILSGPDHLAFIFALLLIGSSVAEVARVVTGFTVAHSVTLGLTVLGYLHPDRLAINALIGLSIAMVAAENIWLAGRRGATFPIVVAGALATQAVAAALGYGCVPALTLAGLAVFAACYFRILAGVANAAALRWAIAFLFGLVHGFGFAGVLQEAQLSPDRLLKALFGFNLGVEIGQIAIVVLIWPPLSKAVQLGRGRSRGLLMEAGSAAVLAIGLFWYVTRAYG